MQFTRLHLQGFKSFVEPTDLEIPAGMTGIVGPNGCGKSNLVEALRWVMGENSPKRMRGSEMDDVIFAGTATRPSRNVAEVMLVLDNANRSATAEFNNDETLEVARQIERGAGSDYRINGRPVRQRDVQLLFADQATGAHSTNLVGQGQIDGLIRAKPQDRRQILEEASGTAGLQARRHEAELKLKAAEQNLLRVDDVLKAYDTQLRSLKQQVRQASRYRNLAEHIRRAEAALLHLRWIEAEQNGESLRAALAAAEKSVAELVVTVTQATSVRTEIAAQLPALRQSEAAAAAIVQKLTLMREQIEAETNRIAAEVEANAQRLAHAQSDREREQTRCADAETALTRLQTEDEQLAASNKAVTERLPQAIETLATLTQDVEDLDAALTHLVQAGAEAEAKKKSLQQDMENVCAQQSTFIQRREQVDAQRVELAAEIAMRPDLTAALAPVTRAEEQLAKRQSDAQAAEQAYLKAERAQDEARTNTREAQDQLIKLTAEAEAIRALLQPHVESAQQIIDLITVKPGLETALATALGEALTAALDTKAAMHWRALPPLAHKPQWPQGVAPLAQHIKAPDALARSLALIGLADDQAAGEKAAPHLEAGQIIVSRDGWAWRWDGFTVTPQAKTATALHLQQRNRLAEMQAEIRQAQASAQTAEAVLAEMAAQFARCQNENREAREALQAAFAALNDARTACGKHEMEAAAVASKLAALDDNLRQITADIADVRKRGSAIEDELASLPDLEAMRNGLNDKRSHLAERRERRAKRQSEVDHLTHEQRLCDMRRATIAQDCLAWQDRLANARQQIEALGERMVGIEAQQAKLRARPDELKISHAKLLSELSEAEARRRAAADRLIETERRLSDAEHTLKQQENALSAAREERVRAEGAIQAAEEHFNMLRERMMEKLNCTPEELPAIAEIKDGEVESVFELEQTLARYVRERDGMGPVNLRAETEADMTQEQIDTLQKEKDDLVAAIAKLRQGISQLNREARERLQNAFTQVNERFQKLFMRLFNGGRAHLEFIEADDPLEAGLEIFASPPGKKMQALSLLSGGERTLTALALLFAVFQTNPSPICVLDEAEAALDESNIDRFCRLVEEIAQETGTRFLIITHQRLTMARMDRLYGVTMGEKGVSQLVSVDLASAVALRDGELPSTAAKAEKALADVRAA